MSTVWISYMSATEKYRDDGETERLLGENLCASVAQKFQECRADWNEIFDILDESVVSLDKFAGKETLTEGPELQVQFAVLEVDSMDRTRRNLWRVQHATE